MEKLAIEDNETKINKSQNGNNNKITKSIRQSSVSLNSELTSSIVSNKLTKSIKSSLNNQHNKKHDLFLQKITYYTDTYYFAFDYVSNIIFLLRDLVSSLHSRYMKLFKMIKVYLKYFKDLSCVQINFSNEITRINSQYQKKNSFSGLIGKCQNKLGECLMNIGQFVKKEIVENENFCQIEGIYTKMENFDKKLEKIFSKLEHRKNKIQNFYKKNFEKIFENFKNKLNDENLDKELIEMVDLILIEHNLINYINKLFLKIEIFLNSILEINEKMKQTVKNYSYLLKKCTDYFVEENKKYSNLDLFSSFGKIEDFTKEFSNFEINEQLSPKFLINSQNKKKKEFNEIFFSFQNNLMKSDFYQNNQVIYDDQNFKIEKYELFEYFIHFLISLLPPKIEVNYNDLIKFKGNFKRDCGVFREWKKSLLIITIQGHIIVFDEDTDNQKENDDINANKFILIYKLGVTGIKEKEVKNKKNCFEIWEIAPSKKKSKLLLLECENQEVYHEILEEILNNKQNEKRIESQLSHSSQ